jgi:hypothetical protein
MERSESLRLAEFNRQALEGDEFVTFAEVANFAIVTKSGPLDVFATLSTARGEPG